MDYSNFNYKAFKNKENSTQSKSINKFKSEQSHIENSLEDKKIFKNAFLLKCKKRYKTK